MVGFLILAVSMTLSYIWLAAGGLEYIDDWTEGVKKIWKRK